MALSTKYFKLTNESCCHNGFRFVEGLNIDTIPFTPYGDCNPGGIYFTTLENIWRWIEYGYKEMYYIWDVIIPEDAQVYHQKDKSKTDKIILSNKKTLYDFFSDNYDIALINIKENCDIFKYIKNKTPEICMEAVKQNGGVLRHIKDRTPGICLAAVQQTGWALEYVYEQTPEICMAAVQQNSNALQYVREQTEDICLAAIKKQGGVLSCVAKQTLELCLEAVKQDGYALRYVENQTPEICMAAVKEKGGALYFVKEQTLELCLEAVRQNNYALRYVENQLQKSIWIQMAALYSAERSSSPGTLLDDIDNDEFETRFIKYMI